MAVIQTGSIVSDIRGSVGTETYGRNQGGLYVRARAGPAGPPTAEQIKITDAMALLSAHWSSDLTDQQRADWRSYAAQHPRVDRWGSPRLSNGYTRFIAVNFRSAVPAGIVNWEDAPIAPPLHPPTFTFTADAGTDVVTVTAQPTNYPVPTQLMIVYAYFGRPQAPGVNFYGSPWFYASNNLFVPGVGWLNDPWNIGHPDDLILDDRLWLKFVIQNIETATISNAWQDFVEIT